MGVKSKKWFQHIYNTYHVVILFFGIKIVLTEKVGWNIN